MDFDQLWERLTPGIHDALGSRDETFILRRDSSLEAVAAGETPNTLAVATSALAGAAAVDLRLPDSSSMKGSLLAGTRLEIAGTMYTVVADVVLPPGTATVLPAVGITPVLGAPAAAGAVVEILSGPLFTFEHCLVMDSGRSDQGGDQGGELSMLVSLPTLNAPTTPRLGDSLERQKDGTVGRVSKIPVMIGGSWEVRLGAG